MLNLFSIFASILLNVLCIWSITFLSKEREKIIYKRDTLPSCYDGSPSKYYITEDKRFVLLVIH